MASVIDKCRHTAKLYFCSMPTFVTSKARENILARIRKGLGDHQSPIPFSEAEKEHVALYANIEGAAKEESFAEAFINLGGKFVFCDNEKELVETLLLLIEERDWKNIVCANDRLFRLLNRAKPDVVKSADGLPEDSDACITGCEAIAARTGSFLFSSRQHLGRTSTIYYPVHIVVAYNDQVLHDLDEAFAAMKRKYGDDAPSMLNITTGPSRTADIEKTLVVGVHGPAEIFCFLVNTDSGLMYK